MCAEELLGVVVAVTAQTDWRAATPASPPPIVGVDSRLACTPPPFPSTFSSAWLSDGAGLSAGAMVGTTGPPDSAADSAPGVAIEPDSRSDSNPMVRNLSTKLSSIREMEVRSMLVGARAPVDTVGGVTCGGGVPDISDPDDPRSGSECPGPPT